MLTFNRFSAGVKRPNVSDALEKRVYRVVNIEDRRLMFLICGKVLMGKKVMPPCRINLSWSFKHEGQQIAEEDHQVAEEARAIIASSRTMAPPTKKKN